MAGILILEAAAALLAAILIPVAAAALRAVGVPRSTKVAAGLHGARQGALSSIPVRDTTRGSACALLRRRPRTQSLPLGLTMMARRKLGVFGLEVCGGSPRVSTFISERAEGPQSQAPWPQHAESLQWPARIGRMSPTGGPHVQATQTDAGLHDDQCLSQGPHMSA